MAGVAIVTGATGGLGMEFIRVISSWDSIDEIWALGRNEDKLKLLKETCGKVVPVRVDLVKDGLDAFTDKLAEEKPDVKLLINNAGAGYFGLYENMTGTEAASLCKLNCEIPAQMISAVLPYMHEGAGILNISSASSFQPNPYLAMYSASKAFLKSLSRALSVELEPRGIKVTAVCPGWIDTEMLPRAKDGKKINYPGIISAQKVVSTALADYKKGKDMSAPGAFAKWFRFYSKLTPTRIVMKQWKRIVGKYI
ncbi:MAG: SDR family NAD(P)-dependent oxidoreductase [Saccharofermentans sp.]|nr:SDR family NAD(P)-dependent oxidoreductase [Saccharofermentans sp.]